MPRASTAPPGAPIRSPWPRAPRARCARSAAVGIGYTWEAEKDHAKAQSAYEAALAGMGPKDFLYEGLLLDLARASGVRRPP